MPRPHSVRHTPVERFDLPALLLDQASVAVVATDLRGLITYANRGAEQLYGTAARQAVGRAVKDVVALPSDSQSVDEIVASVAQSGEWVGETWARRSDGQRIPVLLTVTPLRSHGEVVGMIGIALDNSERHEEHRAHARLIAAIEQTAESVLIADEQANIVYVNPAFERTSGYTLAEVIGKNPRLLQSGTQSRAYYKRMWKTLGAGRIWSGELVNRRKDGTLYREQASITPVADTTGEISTYVAVQRDITHLREVETRLDESTQDRIAVIQALAQLSVLGSPSETAHEIAQALLQLPGVDRGGVIVFGESGGAQLLGYGGTSAHPRREGDQLPAASADYFLGRARQGPWVEMSQPGSEDAGDWAALAASGLRAAAYAPIGGRDPLGLVAIGTEQDQIAGRMVNHLAMAVEFAASAFHLLGDGLRARRDLEATRRRLESIIETSAFHPVFQPIVDISDGQVIGYEALTRFDDAVPPDRVFETAVMVGLATQLEVATLEASIIGSETLPLGPWLSLNVSPALVLEGDLLRSVLANRSRPIVLEITEHQPIPDYAALRLAFGSLGADIRLAVDDAGAGIANFGHIVELHPHFVKIDIGLVRDVNADLTRQALIVGLNHFAQSTGCSLIAEGVETQAEHVTLRSLGVHLGQGYLFGHPEPAPVDPRVRRRPHN